MTLILFWAILRIFVFIIVIIVIIIIIIVVIIVKIVLVVPIVIIVIIILVIIVPIIIIIIITINMPPDNVPCFFYQSRTVGHSDDKSLLPTYSRTSVKRGIHYYSALRKCAMK